MRVHPRELPLVRLEAHDELEVRRVKSRRIEHERAAFAARARVETNLVLRVRERARARGAREHERRRSRELARRDADVRRLPLGRHANRVIEAEDSDLAEVEPTADRPRAARLLAERDARRFVAAREIDDRDVLVPPRYERETLLDRGRAELLVCLDLTHAPAVARDREEHRARPARTGRFRERHRGHRAVVAHAAKLEAARLARPELLPRERVEREHLAPAGRHDDRAGDHRTRVERVRERPALAAREREPDDLVGVPRDADGDVRAARRLRASEAQAHRFDRGAAVVLPVRREEARVRLTAAARRRRRAERAHHRDRARRDERER